MKQLKGYVATLDVLGFSEILQRDGYSEKLRNYVACVDEVINSAGVKAECVLFSDSIVITSPGDDDAAFENILKTCSSAFRALLKNEIPVRGAIAFGRYWREARKGSVFLAGRPIVEAYRCERASDWVGILLCPSAIGQRPNLKLTTLLPELSDDTDGLTPSEIEEAYNAVTLRLQPATVPYRDSDTRTAEELSGYGIVPADPEDGIETVGRTISLALRALDDLRLKAPHPRAQTKYRTTLKWLGEVHQGIVALARLYRAAKKAATPSARR